jgi:hypothetical protein
MKLKLVLHAFFEARNVVPCKIPEFFAKTVGALHERNLSFTTTTIIPAVAVYTHEIVMHNNNVFHAPPCSLASNNEAILLKFFSAVAIYSHEIVMHNNNVFHAPPCSLASNNEAIFKLKKIKINAHCFCAHRRGQFLVPTLDAVQVVFQEVLL